MRNRRDDIEERRVERPIVELWGRLATLSDDELLRVSESARAAAVRPSKPRRRFRWSVVVATLTLLVGSGLGFGLGSSATPSGSARGNVVGLGFIPAEGWNVTQTGAIGETGVARAIAANVPLHSEDESSDLPYATLRRLPSTGGVIVARFSPRGDERVDSRFPLQALPLRVADAVPVGLPSRLSATSLVPLRLRIGAGGYNVDVRVFVGAPLSPALLAAVDRQLGRLVMAPSRVTLVVQPRLIADWGQRLTIFGSVENGREGEKVVVQWKACGLTPPQFRDAFETTTRAGGGFSLNGYFNLKVSGVFRAVAGDSVSAGVPVQQRAYVALRAAGRGQLEVFVSGTVPFWRRHVLLQRFELRRGSWITMRKLVLANQPGGSGSAPPFQTVSTVTVLTDPFRPGVPRGTMLRAVFPLSQARPCYLAGVSETRRT